VIRPFGLRDVLTIRHLQTLGASFDLKRRLLSSLNPARSAVLGLVSGHRMGARTLVHTGPSGNAEPLAFIQLIPREDGSAWDVVALAPGLDAEFPYNGLTPAGLWQDLLVYAILAAAQQNVARIYAQSPCGDESEMLLRRTGFTVVGCEEVFALAAESPAMPLPAGFRPVQDSDAWMLDQLYRGVIPPLVYRAQWEGAGEASPAQLSAGEGREGFVWAEDATLQAHLSVESSPRGHWIDCVVRPERRAELLPHIRYLLHLIGVSPTRPVYFCVPDYAVGLAWLLRTLGFATRGRQQVMVAHTVSRVPVARPIVVEGLKGQPDAAAQRW
jgi:hypothetical protein